MEGILGTTWDVYLGVSLITLGTTVLVNGLRRMWQPLDGKVDLLDWTRGFRRGVLGLALIGMGLSGVLDLQWLLVLSLLIGGEEIFESSTIIGALERDLGRRRRTVETR